MPFSGRKPLIVCNGQVYEADDQSDAEDKASDLATQINARAYILLPTTIFKPGSTAKKEDFPKKA